MEKQTVKALPVNKRNQVKRGKSGMWLVFVAILTLFFIIAGGRASLLKEKAALEAKKAEREEILQSEYERTGFLAERRAYMQTIRYIEEMAREKLGLVYEDEIIFRPNPEE